MKKIFIKRILATMLATILFITSADISVFAVEIMPEDEIIEEEDIINQIDDSTDEPLLGVSAGQLKINNPISSYGEVTWDCIYFGNYWQNDTNGDGNADTNDSKEPIKWRVLSVDGNDAFLLADKSLDYKAYDPKYSSLTWKTCTLRSWLNGYGSNENTNGSDYSESNSNFMDNAFSAFEQDAIIQTNLINADNPQYGTDGGENTSDKVFLLSYDDAVNKAFGFSSDCLKEEDVRVCKNTNFTDNKRKMAGYFSGPDGEYDWWLRSPGEDSYLALDVNYTGSILLSGLASFSNLGVRPALHLNLASARWSYAGTVKGNCEIEKYGDFSGGTGIEEDPYIIADVSDFDNIRKHLDANYKIVSDIDIVDQFTPIGTSATPFTGTIDGGNHVIAVRSYNPYTAWNRHAMFEFVTNATFKNLTIVAVNTIGHNAAGGMSPRSVTGGLLIGSGSGTITNCHARGNLTLEGDSDAVGGLLAGEFNGTILESSAEGSINCYGHYMTHGLGIAGGIVGNFAGTMANCYANAKIKAYGTSSINGEGYMGGLIGNVQGNVEVRNSYFVGTMTDNHPEIYKFYIGGIVTKYTKDTKYKVTCSNCYYNCELAKKEFDFGAKKRNILDLKNNLTYYGWDWDKVWGMNSTYNEGFPYLKTISSVESQVQNQDKVVLKKGWIPLDYDDGRLIDVACDDACFINDSNGYYHSIAQYAIGLSTLVYSSDTLVKRGLKKLGYGTISSNLGGNYYTDITCNEDASGTGEYSPCWIVHKTVNVDGQEFVLLSVIIRGTYHEEWVDNFDSGTSGVHKGFDKAADYVYGNLLNYINQNNLTDKNLKILITGHSRGAATGNLVGKKLDDSADSIPYFKKNNIFVYTFATPNSSINGTNDGYDNIFSIVNPEDFVTKVMPTGWGYRRYGTTFVLPSITTDSQTISGKNYVDFNVWRENDFDSKFLKYSGVECDDYKKGMLEVSDYVNSVVSKVGDVKEYYKKHIYLTGYGDSVKISHNSLFDLYTNVLGYYCSTNNVKEKISYLNMVAALNGEYGALGTDTIKFFFENQFMKKRFEHAHRPEFYLASMNSLTYEEVVQSRKMLYGIVNCPVDVVIKDEEGEIIGSITNNVVDDMCSISSNMIVNGDSKSFMIPYGSDYTIELTGNDEGSMDYSLCVVDPDFGEIERIFYKDVSLADGNKYVCEYNGKIELENQKLMDEIGGEVSITEYITEENLGSLAVNVEVKGVGFASGYEGVTQGDYVVLRAITDSNNEFLGWYTNDDQLISIEREYGMSVEKNMDVVAKFTNNIVSVKNVAFEKNIVHMQVGDVEYNSTLIIPRNATAVKLYYSSEDENIVKVDERGIITALKDGVTYIYVTTEDDSVKASYKVIVGDAEENHEVKWLDKMLKMSDTEYIFNLATKEKYLLSELAKTKQDGKNYKFTYAKTDGKKADSQFASISNAGLVTAKKEGTARISLIKSGIEYVITVNVFDPKFSYVNPKQKYFTVNTGEKTIPSYDDCKLKPMFSLDANAIKKGIANIDSETGEVTALKKGNVTVSATVGEGKNARIVKTTVKIYDPTFTDIKVSKDIVNQIPIGKTKSLKITNGFGTTEWSVSDENIAIIDSKGKIKAVGFGIVVVTAINNGRVMTKEIVVPNPEISGKNTVKVKKTISLKIINGVKNTTWTVSDENVATVKNGVVKGIGPGTVIVTAENNGYVMTKEIIVEK